MITLDDEFRINFQYLLFQEMRRAGKTPQDFISVLESEEKAAKIFRDDFLDLSVRDVLKICKELHLRVSFSEIFSERNI